jgi:(+)-trans-carveol dehydrogenase
MGRFDGRVVFITGAARGMGRSHAVAFAEEGADVIAVDLCAQVPTTPVAMATPEDLAETVRLVEAAGRRIVAEQADVRDQAALDRVLARGSAELGPLDIVVANAGIFGAGTTRDIAEQTWRDVIDVNLTGVWHTVKAALPAMMDGGRGGAIVLISSLCGTRGLEGVAHYTAAKHGVVGLMKSLANEVGRNGIRVNAVLPGNVGTPMILNDVVYALQRPDLEHPTREDVQEANAATNPLGVAFMEPRDISNAVLWLCSDEARFVHGVPLSVDGGWANA